MGSLTVYAFVIHLISWSFHLFLSLWVLSSLDMQINVVLFVPQFLCEHVILLTLEQSVWIIVFMHILRHRNPVSKVLVLFYCHQQ